MKKIVLGVLGLGLAFTAGVAGYKFQQQDQPKKIYQI